MTKKEEDQQSKNDDDVKPASRSKKEEGIDTEDVAKEQVAKNDLAPPHEDSSSGSEEGREVKDDIRKKEQATSPAKEMNIVAQVDAASTTEKNNPPNTTTSTTGGGANDKSISPDIGIKEASNSEKEASVSTPTTTTTNNSNSSLGDQESKKNTSTKEKVNVSPTSDDEKGKNSEKPAVSPVSLPSPTVLKKDHAKTSSEVTSSPPLAKDDEEQTPSTKETRTKDKNNQVKSDDKKNGTHIVPPTTNTADEEKEEKMISGASGTSCRSSSSPPHGDDQKINSGASSTNPSTITLTTSVTAGSSDPPTGEKDRDVDIPSPPEKQSDNPYLNKQVKVLSGQFEGLTGKILKVHGRGWWTLDNPQMNGRNIHPRFCELLDEIDPLVIHEFYKNRSRNRSLPSIVRRQIERANKRKRGEDDPSPVEQDDRKQAAISSEPRTRGRPPTRQAAALRKRNQDSSSSVVSTAPVKKRQKTGHENGGRSSRSSSKLSSSKRKKVLITSSIKGSLQQYPSAPLDEQQKRVSKSNHLVSPPFILPSQGDNYKNNAALQHLPPNYKVEVFNRKNGRILKGKHAIAVKDLHAVLMRHAEYEPIIPPPKFNSNTAQNNDSSSSVRNDSAEHNHSHEARSSVNARINQHVQPQTRVRASAAEGCRVKIIAGPYRGLTGKIESCIPGNWYLISELSKKNKFDFDYIVHSRQLEILPEPNQHSSKTGATKKNNLKDPKKSDERLTLELKKDIRKVTQCIDILEQKKAQMIRNGNLKSATANIEFRKLEDELRNSKERLKTKELSYKMLTGKK
eukprot:CAMPEP_0203664874 /NCGR_PEP_ID=MMETSP0090-20130426/2203_1 /ASSEMBLY_ACC=CAM_ASM_001088 /TAXON_ID=426623 /ORGANISM="Chaetoceros affinis, Strain CCMP159" /LENGTH=794 /DNA_ID=CAMNT_0050528265 /DNA_START=163 /DNA_END=2547 /DNA_ORIENTATION=+